MPRPWIVKTYGRLPIQVGFRAGKGRNQYMGEDNVVFLEVLEWFDDTGKDSAGFGIFAGNALTNNHVTSINTSY